MAIFMRRLLRTASAATNLFDDLALLVEEDVQPLRREIFRHRTGRAGDAPIDDIHRHGNLALRLSDQPLHLTGLALVDGGIDRRRADRRIDLRLFDRAGG
ncbi:MAG TPA: hypothetical protein VGB60_06145 [Brevundimonas sp.]|jgi:hypothetical protein|uniref:hypothetical protein n=1 Tax=Brevundimonas sp. TaxID=1871086 RepID=UPI002ED7750F